MTKPTGVYVSPTEFVSFAEARGSAPASGRGLSEHIATRDRSPDFRALGMFLPNPDPVLKRMGRDVSAYADLRCTASVGGAIRRRKAAVLQMEWRVERGGSSSAMAELVERSLSSLDVRRFLSEALDAPLFGWVPMEVVWAAHGAGAAWVPTAVMAKPHAWFHFNAEGELRFRSKGAPMLGEAVLPRKFLVPAQDATYANPYGFPDLSMVFWPTTFLRGGLKFWVTFTEKFGMPWLVGKTPRGTAKGEQEKLLDQLESMVQDAVAVIPDDSSIDTLKADGKSGSADLYERLLMFCRSEVSIALLGQNQTTEKDSTHASAAAGAGVTDTLRDGDARLCEAALNQLARWIVDLNEGENAQAPSVVLFEQETVDVKQAERDEKLTRSGVRFTPEYWKRTYGLNDNDLQSKPAREAVGAEAASGQASFAEPSASGDALSVAELRGSEVGQMALDAVLTHLQQVVESAANMEELERVLTASYGTLPLDDLRRVMAAAFAMADLQGMVDASRREAAAAA